MSSPQITRMLGFSAGMVPHRRGWRAVRAELTALAAAGKVGTHSTVSAATPGVHWFHHHAIEEDRMATLTAWKFDSPGGADEAEAVLLELQKQELIHIHDAATVSWEEGKRKPKTRQLNSLTGISALSGSFWG